MIFDRAAGTTAGLTENWDRSVDGLVWERDSRSLLGTIDDAGTRRVYRFRLDGGARRRDAGIVVRRAGAVPQWQGRWWPSARASSSRPRWCRWRRAAARRPSSRASTTRRWRRSTSARYESVTYKGARDADIQMWVVYPPGFDAAKKYPVLMLLHGGPHNARDRCRAMALECAGVRELGLRRHLAQLPRLERLRQRLRGLDQSRLDHAALRGHDQAPPTGSWPSHSSTASAWWPPAASYGGFLATTLLGRPHPFKALVAHAAVYNLFTQTGADYGAETARFFNFWEQARGIREVLAAHLGRQFQDADAR